MITPALWLKIGAGALILFVVVAGVYWLVERSNSNQIEELKRELNVEKQDRVRIDTQYEQVIKAKDAEVLAAREENEKSKALNEELERRMGNSRALDVKMANAEEDYKVAKTNLGECVDGDDCLRLLRAQLCANGFKKACDK